MLWLVNYDKGVLLNLQTKELLMVKKPSLITLTKDQIWFPSRYFTSFYSHGLFSLRLFQVQWLLTYSLDWRRNCWTIFQKKLKLMYKKRFPVNSLPYMFHFNFFKTEVTWINTAQWLLTFCINVGMQKKSSSVKRSGGL